MASQGTGLMARSACMVGVLLGLAGCSFTTQSGMAASPAPAPEYYRVAEVESPGAPVKAAPPRRVVSKPRHEGSQAQQGGEQPRPVVRPSRASGDYRQEPVAHQDPPRQRVRKSGKKPPGSLPYVRVPQGPSVARTTAVSKK